MGIRRSRTIQRTCVLAVEKVNIARTASLQELWIQGPQRSQRVCDHLVSSSAKNSEGNFCGDVFGYFGQMLMKASDFQEIFQSIQRKTRVGSMVG